MRDALRRLRADDDAGMTLTELLVAMTIFSVAIAMVFSAVVTTLRWTREAEQSAAAVTELRDALAQIDRQVRSGNVLFSPADESTWVSSCQALGAQAGSCMRIFTQSNGDEKCVQWQLAEAGTAPDGTTLLYELRTRSWATDWSTSGNVSDWRVVASDLTLGAQAPFTLLGASTPYKERSLQVHLEVFDERQDRAVSVDSTLTGRNTSYGFSSSQCTPVPTA